MTSRTGSHPRARHGARRRLLALLTVVGLLTGVAGFNLIDDPASAETTVSPDSPIRDDIVTLTVNPVAAAFGRSGTSATSNFTRSEPGATGCLGDNPAGTNTSPRTIVTVTGPGGEVLNETSPALRKDAAGFATGYPVLEPQPAAGNTNYRGGAYGFLVAGNPASASTTRPWVLTLDLAGKPGGTYTVTTTTQNMIRTGGLLAPGPCVVGRAERNATNTGWANTFVLGPVVEEDTFEYRPWQESFTDVLGNGKVQFNTDPAESLLTIGDEQGEITTGGMTFFAVPGADTILLPANPADCVADPASCLPANATECDPSDGCEPRVVLINRAGGGEILRGFFDLETRAFVAFAQLDGSTRLLFSLGTQGDTLYKDLLERLADAAAAQGIDLAGLLGTTVRVRLGANEYKLSLINGLQIDPSTGPNGIQILSPMTVQAGVILNIYSAISDAECVTQSADSDPATATPDRITRSGSVGYTVEKSDLLPEVPRIGAVGALVGGPIYHIKGAFTGPTPLVNTSTAVIGVDTDADEPNGYPVWVSPFLSGVNTVSPRTMDFLGTATFSASETSLGAAGCFVLDFMLGTGVAIYNNLLPLGFGNVPIWAENPAVAGLMAQINAAVAQVLGDVTADPTVAALLEQITGILPELPVPV